MYLQCDRCLKAGVTCVPDPMHPCQHCHYNKQGCSLMPVNKKTGKTDWHNLTEAEIFHFRVAQLKKKQDALGHKKPEASGSKTSLLTMLSVLALESRSSHSPPAASDSPAAATASDSPAPLGPSSQSPPAPAAAGLPATMRVAAPCEVNFYIEVPAHPRQGDYRALSTAVAIAPATTTAVAATLPDATDPPAMIVPTTAAIPVAAVSTTTPTITITDTAPAASTPTTAITDTDSAAASTIAVADRVPADSSTISTATTTTPSSAPALVGQLLSPTVGSSSLKPSLHRHLKTSQTLPSPPHLQPSDVDNSQPPAPNNLMERVALLERRMDAFEDWIRKDENWKEALDEKLQKVVSMLIP